MSLDSFDLAADNELFPRIQRGIQESPNLRKLDLRVSREGCIVYNYNTEFSSSGWTLGSVFSSDKPANFPPLEELKLRGLQLSSQSVDYWIESMDWSHMRVLDLGDESTSTALLDRLTPASEHVPSVETLKITLPWNMEEPYNETLHRFISSSPKDRVLEIEVNGAYQQFIDNILNSTGSNLKRLTLHEPEKAMENSGRC